MAEGSEVEGPVVFIGSARENKGLRQLLSAWAEVRALMRSYTSIGTQLDTPLVVDLQVKARPTFGFVGLFPLTKYRESCDAQRLL